MTRPGWNAQDLADKGYREVAEKWGRHGASGSTATSQSSKGAAVSPYRSKWEAAYAQKLELEKRAGIIKEYWYEPFSLWLPGKVRYKPDFLVEYQQDMEDDVCHMPLNIVEVKGWSKNKRDGMTRLKIARALFPCFRWVLAKKTKQGWDEVQP